MIGQTIARLFSGIVVLTVLGLLLLGAAWAIGQWKNVAIFVFAFIACYAIGTWVLR